MRIAFEAVELLQRKRARQLPRAIGPEVEEDDAVAVANRVRSADRSHRRSSPGSMNSSETPASYDFRMYSTADRLCGRLPARPSSRRLSSCAPSGCRDPFRSSVRRRTPLVPSPSCPSHVRARRRIRRRRPGEVSRPSVNPCTNTRCSLWRAAISMSAYRWRVWL